MTVIDRYILREVFQLWLGITLILILVLASNSLVQLLDNVAEGQLSADVIAPFFLLQLVTHAVTIIPLGMFLALLLAFGRLYAQGEMAALGACGTGPARLYRPVVVIGMVGAVVTAAFSIWVAPWGERMTERIAARVAAQSAFAGVNAGRFNQLGGDIVLFAERRTEADVLREVFVVVDGEAGKKHIVRAASARLRVDPDSGRRYIEFRDGQRYRIEPGSATARRITFERHGIYLPEKPITVGSGDPEAMSLGQLLARGEYRHIAAFQWRLSLPIACLLLAMAALPLSYTTPRKGRFGRIATALVVYLAYTNLLIFARELVADGNVPRVIGMWWTHVVCGALIAVLVTRHVGWRWTAMVLRRDPEVVR